MLRNFLTLSLLFFTMLSCGSVDEYYSDEEQLARIEDYLSSENIEYTYRDYVYKEILNVDENASELRITEGDSVYLYYAGYSFDTSIGSLYTTNIAEIALNETVPYYTDFEPLKIVYGKTDIIDGLESGLYSAQEGDSLMLYMPSKVAYGDKVCGILEKYSSVAMMVNVFKIVK